MLVIRCSMNKIVYISSLFLLVYVSSAQAQIAVKSRATDEVQIRVVIPEILRVRVVKDNAAIRVTPHDIASGYVDLPQAFVIQYWCNDMEGASMEMQVVEGLVNERGVRLPMENLQLRQTGGEGYVAFDRYNQEPCTRLESGNGRYVSLDLRLRLDATTEPGVYRYGAAFNLVKY